MHRDISGNTWVETVAVQTIVYSRLMSTQEGADIRMTTTPSKSRSGILSSNFSVGTSGEWTNSSHYNAICSTIDVKLVEREGSRQVFRLYVDGSASSDSFLIRSLPIDITTSTSD